MGTVAKSYTTIIVAGVVARASAVRKAFDDVYDTVNGNLDSANLSASFKSNWFAASQISVVTGTGWTSTSITELQSTIEDINSRLKTASDKIDGELIQDFTTIGNLGSANQQYAGHIWSVEEPGTTSSEVLALYLFTDSASKETDEQGVYTLSACNVTVTAGIFGSASYAVEFLGTTASYITQPTLLDDSATYNVGIAIDFWFKTNEGHQQQTCVLKINTSSSDRGQLQIYIDDTGTIVFQTYANEGAADEIYAHNYLSSGSSEWIYVCCNWDETNGKRLWLNGELAAYSTSATSIMAAGTDDDFRIGAARLVTGGIANPFDGKISMFRVRNKALTQKDVDIAYASTYNAPAIALTDDMYNIRSRFKPAADDEFDQIYDFQELIITRNSATIYRMGGIRTGFTATDTLYLKAY